MDTSGMTQRDTEDLFNSLDDNNNGLVEYSEFMTALMTRELSLHSDSLRKAFKALDLDNDGSVDTDELYRGLGGINDKDGNLEEFCSTVMSSLDP